ncbi:MAG: domain protein repeat-containing protein [Acidobacteria bacterium]|nr:domain protein repeat-containing protein [Acidobacteriota bacterium]
MRSRLILMISLGLVPLVRAQEYSRPTVPSALNPVVRGLRISNDRWPDASTLRSFAEGAIRIERARTQEEEAVALYNWIARVMTIGGSPYEGPPGREVAVADPLKFLAVYGNHWCDGQARILETMWRSLGRQGCRLYIPMRHHSFVELYWRDEDGKERWHALDVNNGWYVRNEQGWIASSEDIERNPLLVTAVNQDLKMRTKGWLRTHLSQMSAHSMELDLRQGESVVLLWDNAGIYYVNSRTRASVSAESPLYKQGGPYSHFIGGGELLFSPDLSRPEWADDLAEAPANVALRSGRLTPAMPRDPAVFTYHFDFPYLISDAVLECAFSSTDPQTSAAISFSADGGRIWNRAWSLTGAGQSRARVNLGIERDRSGLPSVLGMYSYAVRFQLKAMSDIAAVSFADIKFSNRVMMNKMALPNLEPGWNRINVAAQSMAPGTALRVALEWSDKNGVQHIERTASSLPFEFDVFANCSGGNAVKMHSLRLEAVRPHKPAVSSVYHTIIEAGLRREKGASGRLIEALQAEDPELRYWSADALGKLGSPDAIPALIRALSDAFDAVRMSACVALGDLKAAEAVPVLIDIASGKIPAGKHDHLFVPVEVGEVQWMAAQALGRIGDERAVDPLMKILPTAGGDLGMYVAQALGDLHDRRAVPALIEEIKRREEPELRGVAEALGRIGDPQAVPALVDLLQAGKEDVRYAAATALGHMGDARAVEALLKVKNDDPQAFVREAAESALKRLGADAPQKR